MSQITGGHVLYGRTVKVADYENKRAEVQFDFVVSEGESHAQVAATAAISATTMAHKILGLAMPAEQQDPGARGSAPAGETSSAAAPEAPKRGRPAKAQQEPQPPVAATHPASPEPSAQTGDKPKPDPLNMDDEFSVAAEKEVTDAELNHACQKARLDLGGDAKAIRELLSGFNPNDGAPFSLRQLPKARRGEFMAALVALVAANKK